MAEYPEQEWSLDSVASNELGEEIPGDLYLFDYSSDLRLPECRTWGRTHFVLLRKHDVPAFQDRYPQASASILLKPVTRPTLRGVFEQVVASKRAGESEDARALRLDRDELLQCLIQANLKLQEYDQERTNFLTRAVHDFRAPVTAISGYCGLLLEGHLGPLTSSQKEVLQRMLTSSKRLTRMANGMVQLGVGKHIDQPPVLRPGDIRECVEQAIHEIVQFTEEKNIEVGVDMAPPTGLLFFETGQLEQVLVNLLDNACKFTPRQGWIDIKGYPYFWDRRLPNISEGIDYDRRARASREPNAYRIDIQDSGLGVRPEHLDTIFEDYTSYAGHGGNDSRAGTGLGLAICKMIVTRHEGKIWAESRTDGASFSFVLPCRNEPQAPPSRVSSWQSNHRPSH